MVTIGTRPEAIKMAPVVKALRRDERIETLLCVTGQHREMLRQALAIFKLVPDFDLDVMQPKQTLSNTTTAILAGLETIFETRKPDRLVVHGDTLTTFVTSLAGFYHHIPVAHVEAGLRTGDMKAPWPEEGNRRLTAVMTDLHFAPTVAAKQNLEKENISSLQIHVTGNTVIDALLDVAGRLNTAKYDSKYAFLADPFVLVTGHRRENFGDGIQNLCDALIEISERENVSVLYPVHLNPNISGPVRERLKDQKRVHLVEPVDYEEFVYLMKRSKLILTDSGGIQEEAPSLGKPVLVMRERTERPEAVEAGTAKLVGTDRAIIVAETTRLLRDHDAYERMSKASNPYGDGKAGERIAQILIESLL